MQAIDFAVRTPAGDVQFDAATVNGDLFAIEAQPGHSISLNLEPSSLRGYTREGGDLLITLSDGRVILIEDYFEVEGARLFLSANGRISEVVLTDAGDGVLLATYGVEETFGKWSPHDELIFLDDDGLTASDTGYAALGDAEDGEVSMLATGLLGTTLASGTGAAAAAAGGAALIGAGVIGGGDDGGSGGGDDNGPTRIEPAIDDAGTSATIYGDAEQTITVSGVAEPGSTIAVTVGETTLETVSNEGGTWSVAFEGDDFPADGNYTVTAVVTEADGTVTDLTGATSDIDVTPPEVDIQNGTSSPINAEVHEGGVTLSGNVEEGSTVVVTINGTDYDATVTDGTWSATFDETVFPEGEYSQEVTVTATDAAGNSSSVTGTVVIDTVTSVTADTDSVGGDGTVNGSEAAGGVTLTGTAEPGSSVDVTLGGVTLPATVDDDGNWTVTYPASDLPQGETVLDVTAVSTDQAGNTATATGSVAVDTLVSNFAFTSQAGGADSTINAEEAAQGLTVTGTTEPGATVTVTFAGFTRAASVAADGSWSVDYAAGEIPSGTGAYQISASSTDRAGNTDTITQDVRIDTDAGSLTISAAPVEGDDVVNAAEASDGVTLTGTSEPGQSVTVTMAGVSMNVITGPNGVWTANYAPGQIAAGTYTAEITATITDSAGNTLTRTDSVRVDTEVQNFGVSAAPVEGDGVVNADEMADGVVLSGTTEPGSSVTVTIGGVTRTANVDGNGNWSANFGPGSVASGTYGASATIVATDMAGNTSETSTQFQVDTEVETLVFSPSPVAGDDVVNAAEAAQGLTLTGQVEPGSTVLVTLNGVTHAASVDAGGNWNVDFAAAELPSGELSQDVTIAATDAAGNTRSETRALAFDTEASDAPEVTDYTRNHSGLTGVSLESTDDAIYIGHLDGAGGVEEVGYDSFDVPNRGETSYFFNETVPDGSHLVVTVTDEAGNTAGTFHVVDDPATNQVGMTDALAGQLGAFEIERIDLQFAEDTQLTLTEAQITALAQGTDELTITGGVDDTVTITGAQAAGQVTENGETFNVYSLGDAVVKIEDDITNVVI